jgi:hypothetical protein
MRGEPKVGWQFGMNKVVLVGIVEWNVSHW